MHFKTRRILPFVSSGARIKISLIFLGFGVFLLVQVIMPIIAFQIWEFTSYNQNQTLLSPDPNSQVLGVSIKNTDDFPAFYSENKRSTPAPYKDFYLSIPAIKLDRAHGLVDVNNFDNNLALLPGAPLPGEKGNVFITGHSSLPQLFRPGNYKAIFAHLLEIKKGDDITVEAGGQTFHYIVDGFKIINPSDLSVINPPDKTGRYLTLMTCTPPGFSFRRLIVLAALQT